MRDDVLGKVVEVEKNIQRSIQSETEKVQEWLEKVKSECDEKVSAHEQEARDAFERRKQHAGRNAKEKASVIVNEALKKADKITSLSQETLKRIVMQHIEGILP